MPRRKKPKPARAAGDQQSAGADPSLASRSKKKLTYSPDEADAAPSLTVREEQVNHWVVRGKENDEIASILGANPETIRKHVENIRRKAGVESRLALLAAHWQRREDELLRINAELQRKLRQQDKG